MLPNRTKFDDDGEYMRFRNSQYLVALLMCVLIGTGPAVANGQERVPNPDQKLATVFCPAKQVFLNANGNKFALLSKDTIGLTDSPLFHMPGMQIINWPKRHSLVSESAQFQPSVKVVTALDESTIIGTTVFGSIFSLKRLDQQDWLRDKDQNHIPSWAKRFFVRWPSQIYLHGPISETLAVDLPFNPSMDGDSRFVSNREYNGLISRTLIGPDLFDIGSEVDGKLYWRKNFNGKVEPLPDLHRFIYSDLSFARVSDGTLAIIGRGIHWPNPSDQTKPDMSLPLYANPVVELGTGIVNFYAAPTKIIALSPSQADKAKSLQKEVDRWVARGWYLHHMTTSSGAKKTILLFRNLNDPLASSSLSSASIVLIDDSKNQPMRFVCNERIASSPHFDPEQSEDASDSTPGARAPNNLPEMVNGTIEISRVGQRIFAVSTIPRTATLTNFVEFSQDGYRIGLWSIQQAKDPKGTIVWIRGGPADTVFGRGIGQLEHHALNAGYRIVWVDYSGAENTSYDIGIRLGKDRVQSIKRDAAAVQAFLRQQGFSLNKPTVVFAESFGSALAAELLRNDDGRIKKAFLTVPAGTWVDPHSENQSGQSERGKRGQALYDRMVAGAPTDQSGNSIGGWYKDIRAELCNDPRTVFMFGGNDTIVRPSEWQPECANHAAFHVLPGANHQLWDDPRAIEILKLNLSGLR